MPVPVLRLRRSFRLAFASLLLAACSDPAGSRGLVACDQPVSVSVGAGTQPEISWTPRCGVVLLGVEEIGSPATSGIRWSIAAFGTTLLEPPIRYGSDPGGGIDIITFPGTPLESGHTYRVSVFKRGIALQNIEIGNATFTP